MGERHEFKSNGSTASGYLARPSQPGPRVVDRQLTSLGKRHEFHTYADAQHAFFNDERPEVFAATPAADAWEKTLAFCRRELKG